MAPPSKTASAVAAPNRPTGFVPSSKSVSLSGSNPAQPRRKSLMRKYEVASLNPDGSEHYSEHIAPASMDFEAAFAGFAHGTMIATPHGPRAVEDIVPGTMIDTSKGYALPVQWVGKMMLVPSAPVENPEQLRLTRIMADSFGLSRPAPDLCAYGGVSVTSARAPHPRDHARA